MRNARAYGSFMKIRLKCGVQYRSAALSGIVTQFIWGFMQIQLYLAFYQANPDAFPMGISQLVAYFWLQQAFMNLFMTWFIDQDIMDAITNGGIAYELCRPMDLYAIWFLRSFSSRAVKTVLRCFPILILALCMPEPYRLMLPADGGMWVMFLTSLVLGFLVVVTFSMLIYVCTIFTVSPIGVRIVALSAMEFLSGGIIPIPFMPDSVRRIVEYLPFACMQNMPYRIFSGDLSGVEAILGILQQAFWFLVLLAFGRWLMGRAIRRAVIQGG
jgi:ABC-2 type transport system permease protein